MAPLKGFRKRIGKPEADRLGIGRYPGERYYYVDGPKVAKKAKAPKKPRPPRAPRPKITLAQALAVVAPVPVKRVRKSRAPIVCKDVKKTRVGKQTKTGLSRCVLLSPAEKIARRIERAKIAAAKRAVRAAVRRR